MRGRPTPQGMSSGTLADMCDIVRESAGEKRRYFARGDGDTREMGGSIPGRIM